MNNKLYELSINNNKQIIPEIAFFVSQSAYKLGLSKLKSDLLCFTIESVLELRTDEINDDNPLIKVIAEDNGSYFKFSVIDYGKPYILTDYQRVILKRKLVDKYSFSQMGRKGQCFSFSFKYDCINKLEKHEENNEELLDNNISFRRVKNTDRDVLNVVNCLYETYGYEYYHQNLYSVEAFRKYMRSNRYIPIIGENDHSQVICYCALDENSWFKGVPELSNLTTRPIARGKGYATSIFKETEKVGKELKYEGIHVSAVAYHPYTQKMCNKFNYIPTAIEYSINPIGTGGDTSGRRLDCVIGAKIFNKRKKHNLYINSSCKDLINYIYGNLNLKYSIISKGKYENENEIECCVDSDTNNCFMRIDKCAKTFNDEIENILNKEEVKEVDVITINLNMNSISAINGFNILKEKGFIATGVIPACKNGNFLLLQKFKKEPAYKKIVLLENYQELEKIVYKLNNIRG